METESKQIPPVTPKEIKNVVLTNEELQSRNEDVQLMCNMRFERDRQHPELDGMTWLEYYESNRKKDLSYLPPKVNKQDVRISSGLTREKDTTLLSTMLGMNFTPDVTAFDADDLMVAELGDNLSDLVKKTREIEAWTKKRSIIYRELIAQGDVFVQEIFVDDFKEMPLDETEWSPERDKVSEYSLRTRLQKIFSGCAVRMINAKKIYLSSMKTEYVEDQDAVAILNVYSRQKAWNKYCKWERWENVPTTIDTIDFNFDGATYKTWNMVNINSDQIAEVMLYQPSKNRFQIYLNGVPMLPANYLMTNIYPSGELSIAQGKLEPISDFALSKSQPSKVKIDQEVLDEATKLMIEAMRQGRKPAMGSRGKKVYSPGIFYAGRITPDIKEGDIFPLWANQGLNTADFSFYSLIKGQIDEKTVNKTYEGQNQEGSQTATQIQQDKQQQMLKLGLALDGVMNLEKRMTWLRIYNFIQNMTKKYDPYVDSLREGLEGQYRKFTVGTTLENGEKGVKMFRFQTDKYPDVAKQQLEERDLTKEHGQEVRIVYMNPEILRSIKYSWFILINPTPNSNDDLTQILFIQNLRQAYELFGAESINQEYAKQRYAILINEDYNKLFKKMDVMQMLQMGQNDPAVQNAMGNGTKGGNMANGMAGGTKSASGARNKPMRAAIQ
jgi:hypothetical protein